MMTGTAEVASPVDMANDQAADPRVVGQRSRRVLIAMTTTMVLLVLDSSIVGVMLPSMGRDLELTTVDQAWVVSAYLLPLAVLLPVGGKIADAFGPVAIFVVGMMAFVVASVGIALSDSAAALISWRAIAGGAGALLMPSTMSILVTAFPGEQRAKAMAMYIGVGQAFATVGPFVGGVCAEFFSWQVAFLINVPVGITGVVLVVVSRPASPRTPVRSWDVTGLILLVLGLTGLVLALLQAPQWGWFAAATLGCAAVGAIALAIFIIRSLRTSDGLLNLRLFGLPVFSGASVVLFSVGFALTIATVYGAIVLQTALALPPAASGIALLPLVIPLLIATKWVAGSYNRLGPRQVGVTGGVCLAPGLLLVATGLFVGMLWVVCCGLALVGIGIGLLMSPMTTAALSAVPEDQRGQGSGLVSTCRQLGGIVGVGVLSALMAVRPIGQDSEAGTGVVIGFGIGSLLAVVAVIAVLRCLPRIPAVTQG